MGRYGICRQVGAEGGCGFLPFGFRGNALDLHGVREGQGVGAVFLHIPCPVQGNLLSGKGSVPLGIVQRQAASFFQVHGFRRKHLHAQQQAQCGGKQPDMGAVFHGSSSPNDSFFTGATIT